MGEGNFLHTEWADPAARAAQGLEVLDENRTREIYSTLKDKLTVAKGTALDIPSGAPGNFKNSSFVGEEVFGEKGAAIANINYSFDTVRNSVQIEFTDGETVFIDNNGSTRTRVNNALRDGVSEEKLKILEELVLS